MAEQLTQAQLDQALAYVQAKTSSRVADYDLTTQKVGTILLDTWTPTILKTDKATTLTATVNLARFYKIGRIVNASIEITAIGDPGGADIFISLPFTPETATITRYVGAGYGSKGSDTMCWAYIPANDITYISCRLNDSSAWGATNAIGIGISYIGYKS